MTPHPDVPTTPTWKGKHLEALSCIGELYFCLGPNDTNRIIFELG